jgi:hypothetical protein
MYQLRKVYSTISFEANKVKLLVVERNTNTTNCLYYDEFEQEYLDRAFSFINIDALVENIQKMLKNADIFLGRPIRRHVVHIPCLPTISVHDESPNFLIFNQQLDEYKYFNFVNKIKRCVINDNRTVIKIYPKE